MGQLHGPPLFMRFDKIFDVLSHRIFPVPDSTPTIGVTFPNYIAASESPRKFAAHRTGPRPGLRPQKLPEAGRVGRPGLSNTISESRKKGTFCDKKLIEKNQRLGGRII
jgi:hypothetical protein